MEYIEEIQEQVILVGVQLDENDNVKESLDELEELADTAGAQTVGKIIQNRETVHPGTYIGKGKIEEVRALMLATDATGIKAKYADYIIHVVDCSNPQAVQQMEVVYDTLQELGVQGKKTITLFNKVDVGLWAAAFGGVHRYWNSGESQSVAGNSWEAYVTQPDPWNWKKVWVIKLSHLRIISKYNVIA